MITACTVLIDEELYGAHGVEPCVSGPRSPRLGASYAQLQETIEDEMADVSTVLAFWSNSDCGNPIYVGLPSKISLSIM